MTDFSREAIRERTNWRNVKFNCPKAAADLAHLLAAHKAAVDPAEALAAALPDPDQLERMATWFGELVADLKIDGGNVEADLRLWAGKARAALAQHRGEKT